MRTTNKVLIMSMIFLNCVIPSEPPQDIFRMSLCASDTVSPYSSIKIAFSSSLEDSQRISFHFNPPFFDYYSVVYTSLDTIQIFPSAPLKGNTRYTLFPEDPISSTKQMEIRSTDSLSFHTFPLEQEPNNTIETADPLIGRKTYGSVSNLNDTDFYSIKDKKASGFYLISHNSQSVFSISDSTGKFTPDREYKSADSLIVPDSFKYPLYLRVYSYYRSSGGNYELGSITK